MRLLKRLRAISTRLEKYDSPKAAAEKEAIDTAHLLIDRQRHAVRSWRTGADAVTVLQHVEEDLRRFG